MGRHQYTRRVRYCGGGVLVKRLPKQSWRVEEERPVASNFSPRPLNDHREIQQWRARDDLPTLERRQAECLGLTDIPWRRVGVVDHCQIQNRLSFRLPLTPSECLAN